VETIRQESCGSVAPSVFMGDWKILLDNGFVVGLPTNEQRPRVTFVEIYQTFPRSVGSGLF
jgi:hypothetical protein